VDVGHACKGLRAPNHYTCECSCPKPLAAGVHAETTAQVSPASSPGGPAAGNDQAQASTGTIIGGPGQPTGTTERWWQVDFDTGTDGWVSETQLAVTDLLAFNDLDVCVPPTMNPNLSGGHSPTEQEVEDDCNIRAGTRFQQLTGQDVPTSCSCDAVNTPATHTPAPWDATCDAPCADPGGVCVLARETTIPAAAFAVSEPPAPDPMSGAVFGATSTCEVQGTLTIDVDGHRPDPQPAARGVVRIHGKRCPPGEICQTGVSFQLKADDITFDSGSIFVDDPTFRDLTLSGASAPDAVTLGPFLGGCCLGPLAPDSTLGSVRGRRSGTTDFLAAVLTNPQDVAGLIVDWEHKSCTMAGYFTGGLISNGGYGDGSASVDVYLSGTLVNQPPDANPAATGRTVECTSAQGANVTLNGSASTDADNNIAWYAWRRDSSTGPYVSAPSQSSSVTTLQAPGQKTYALRVVDDRFATDDDAVDVSVVDTTQPTIACNAPATITPNDVPEGHRAGLSFRASATDVCSGVSRVAVTSFTCTKRTSCRVQFQGDTLTILDSGGVGDVITWTVAALDVAGNGGQKTCQVTVVKKR
jgi:hypothetical protein